MEFKKLNIKKWLVENQETPFYYLAGRDVNSIKKATFNPKKMFYSVDFSTNNGDNLNLKVKDELFNHWKDETNQDKYNKNTFKNFTIWFIDNSEPMKNNLDEIVDEFNNIIGSDIPPNTTGRIVGLSSKDSTEFVKQNMAKPNRYLGNYGLGFITW